MLYQKTKYRQEPRLWTEPERILPRLEEAEQRKKALAAALADTAVARREVLSLKLEGSEDVCRALEGRYEDLRAHLEEAEEAFLAVREEYEDSLWFFGR